MRRGSPGDGSTPARRRPAAQTGRRDEPRVVGRRNPRQPGLDRRRRIEDGRLLVGGAIYHVETGAVEFLEPEAVS